MEASALHAEIAEIVEALDEGVELDPTRPARVFEAIQRYAAGYTRQEQAGLAEALIDLESAVMGRQAAIQHRLRKAGKGRQAMRGYGWLKPNRRGQRMRKKA